MISGLKRAWQKLRAHYWLSLAFDAVAILLVFLAINAWQTRELPINESPPETRLAMLDESGYRPAVRAGAAGVVYFFAPWCFYCRNSIDNLDSLVADGTIEWATVIALDYADRAEVQAFIDDTGVSLPVLMGNRTTASDWSVRAFPTYFVIDSQGRITSRSVGYSSWLGLKARVALAD